VGLRCDRGSFRKRRHDTLEAPKQVKLSIYNRTVEPCPAGGEIAIARLEERDVIPGVARDRIGSRASRNSVVPSISMENVVATAAT